MKRFATVLSACAMVLLLFVMANAQDTGDNQFHFVASFPDMPEGGNGQMTNVRYVGDTDQDGMGEFAFITTNGDSCHFVVYEATGDNTYEIVYLYPIIPVPNGLFRDWSAVTVGDLNGNGLVEIIVGFPVDMTGNVVDHNPPRMAVFEWNGVNGQNVYGYDNGVNPSAVWNFNVADDYSIVPFAFEVTDIDKDGTMELIAQMREPKAVYVISQTDSWDFPNWNIEWYITNDTNDPNYVNHFDGGGLYCVASGDLDSDGKMELFVPPWDRLTLNIYECQAPGTFTREAYIRHVSADTDYGTVRGIQIGDVNNDGVKEMYFVATDKDENAMGHVFAVSNITDVSQVDSASFVDLIVYPTHPLNTTSRAARTGLLTDMDQDGKMDIMICGSGNGQVYDVEYKGSGDPLDSNSWTFTVAFDVWNLWATYLPADTINLMSPRFWDGDLGELDGDGHKEMVVLNYGVDRSIVPDDPWFYIFEEGEGTGVENEITESTVQTYRLYNNYPNPFNPTTIIKYAVPKESFITINVYNMLGEEVKSLVSRSVTAGEYQVEWDGTDNSGRRVSSGLYLYRMDSGEHIYTRTMSLVK